MTRHLTTKIWLVIFYLGAFGSLVLISLASFSSSEVFSGLYQQVTEQLSINELGFSVWLRGSPAFGHVLGYGLLGFMLSGVLSRRRFFFAPVIASILGALMEAAQLLIPSRAASFSDIGMNVLGVGLGFGVYWLLQFGPRGEFART